MSAAARHVPRIIDRDVDFYMACFEQEHAAQKACPRAQLADRTRLMNLSEQVVLALMRYRNAIDTTGPATHATKDTAP